MYQPLGACTGALARRIVSNSFMSPPWRASPSPPGFARYAARRAHRSSFKVLKHLFAALPFGVGMSFLLS
jgi:hypothetical protein